ncbi:MAG: peptidoglycan DD-metalloendopeptidase family protein [Candidatus Parcubacteria bacterium]|nr:peptidoglycan DD-metalloendopeptidase family protein [Candidatus Parcubacteria bacterium]
MKKMMIAFTVVLAGLIANTSWAHDISLKKNPTNENGIEVGVINAASFPRWRVYVKGMSNNSQGQNTGFKDSGNGWWYYDLADINQKVMWRLDGLANQTYLVTYWVFKSDGTWEYGPQVQVISDQIIPDAQFTNLTDASVYQQSTFNIKVASSDNLSGVEAIRIYAVTPAATCAISGVGIDLPTPPPLPAQAPLAPSNLSLTASGLSVQLVWTDNATTEDGFKLYRNDQLLSSLAANTASYTDNAVEYGKPYTYRLYAYKADLNSSAIEGSITLTAPPSGDYRYADSFIYPVACPGDKIYRQEPDDQIPGGACFDYQPLGSLFAYSDKCHQGCDINYKGVNDLGKPLYAIANALIWDFGWTQGWGNYLILRIQSYSDQPFMLSDGTTVSEIYVLYGHLNEIKVIKDNGQVISQSALVKKQTYLLKGWQLGTIGDANGNFSPHLHFEIRKSGYSQLGAGYWTVTDLNGFTKYFVDPLEFIDNNRSQDAQLKFVVHSFDRDSSRNSFLDFNSALWTRQGRLSDGLPLAAVGWSNFLWLTPSSNVTDASWNFKIPYDGAYSVYVVLPRYYGQAKGVRYKVWHSSTDETNPYQVQIDQTNDDANRLVYLGTFDYYSSWKYSVVVSGKTADNPAKTVAVDSIQVVYEGDLGTGGGGALPPALPPEPEQVPTITSEGQVTFKYVGTYLKPEFRCWGSGLSWDKVIFSNGTLSAAVDVSYSDTVYCNAKFEDNRWLAEASGILPNQHLFVNDQEIFATADNGLGGRNILFGLVVNTQDGDTGADDWHGTIDVHVNGDDLPKSWGCVISATSNDNIRTNLLNWLILFLPALVLAARRLVSRI